MDIQKIKQKNPAAVSSADIIGGNMDIVAGILKFLPVKTIVTFKVVSKQWQLFISDDHFCMRHFRQQFSQPKTPRPEPYFHKSVLVTKQNEAPFLLNPKTTSISSSIPSLSYLDDIISHRSNSYYTILQAVNGVLLCEFILKTSIRVIIMYVITNPINRDIHVLPSLSNSFDPDEMVCYQSYHMVFDSFVSDHIRVFCVKNVENPRDSGDYDFDFQAGACMVYVYTFETERWEPIHSFDLHSRYIRTRGVYWNCGIHWIGSESSMHYDIKENKITVRDLPRHKDMSTRYCGESHGHLHLVQVRFMKSDELLSVLELNKEKWKWVEKYNVRLGRIIKVFPEVATKVGRTYEYHIVGVVREEQENEDDSVLVMSIPGKVIAYNFKYKNVKQLRELDREISDELLVFSDIYGSIFQYAESLFPVRQRSLSNNEGYIFPGCETKHIS